MVAKNTTLFSTTHCSLPTCSKVMKQYFGTVVMDGAAKAWVGNVQRAPEVHGVVAE